MANLSAISYFLISLLTVAAYVGCVEDRRNVTISYNDGCDILACAGANDTFYNLVHFRAVGAKDVIHYVWSTIGAPSLLMVRTGTKAALKVDWNGTLQSDNGTWHPENGTISFEPAEDVYSSSAYVIARLLEFNDSSDTADMTNATATKSIDLWNLAWGNITVNETTNTVNFSIKTGHTPAAENGTLSLMVKVLGVEGRSSELPHLQNLPNTTEFSLILDNLEIEENYTCARFAVEMLIFRNQSQGASSNTSGIELNDIPSIDDEHTPAVFQTYQLMLQSTSSSSKGSFMQWKPVVYTSSDRTTGDSKPSKVYTLNLTNHYVAEYSMAYAYNWNMSQLELGSFNISFGITADEFYNASRYYVWSSVVGYGDPPGEGLSLLIITIISVGLGIPVILILFGGIFVACKKRIARNKENSLGKYTSINS